MPREAALFAPRCGRVKFAPVRPVAPAARRPPPVLGRGLRPMRLVAATPQRRQRFHRAAAVSCSPSALHHAVLFVQVAASSASAPASWRARLSVTARSSIARSFERLHRRQTGLSDPCRLFTARSTSAIRAARDSPCRPLHGGKQQALGEGDPPPWLSAPRAWHATCSAAVPAANVDDDAAAAPP